MNKFEIPQSATPHSPYAMFKKIIPYITILLFLAIGVVYFLKNKDQFSAITVISWPSLWFLVLSAILLIVINGLIFKTLLRMFDIDLKIWESIGLAFITSMGNYIIPMVGGIGLRASYLKKRYGFPLSWMMSTILVTGLLTIILNAFFGMLITLIFFLRGNDYILPLLIIFFIAFTGGTVILFFPYKEIKYDNFISRKLNSAMEGWKKIRNYTAAFRRLLLLIFCMSIMNVVLIFLAFRIFTVNFNIFDAAVISTTNLLAALIGIIPTRLGISEAIIVLVSRGLGYIPALSLTSAVIRRIVLLILSFSGGAVFSFIFARQLSHASDEKEV